jgi:phenylpropionate dioxygenase-like ring-hydroxylating dioxygenase large terminal subunit
MNALELTTETGTSSRIYTDPQVFSQELEHIWYRTWLMVGHESEIAKPGDFKTTYLGRKPVILCRDEQGEIQVLLNSCRHRGTMVCRERAGNTMVFQCMYHAWAYDTKGALTGVPGAKSYGAAFRKEDFNLHKLPRVQSYRGVIFASFNPDVRPLEEHLGAAAPLIDQALGAGSEVIGIHEYEYRGNWKLHLENTIDGYHPRYLHRLFAVSGLWSKGEARDLGNGHGALVWANTAAKGDSGKLMGLDASDTTPETSRALVVFPNMVLVHIADLINLRMVIPVAQDRTQVYATALGLKGEKEDVRMRRATQLSAAQGPAGVAGADDIELFEAVQEGLQATLNGESWLDMSRGSAVANPAGANPAIGDLEDETAVRGCYKEWRRLMADAEVPA